jgi:hypothetical protein
MKGRVLFVLLLLAGAAAAQVDSVTTIRRVRVRVVFATGECDAATQVMLSGGVGLIAKATANELCAAEFFNVPAGIYHLSVTGRTIAATSLVPIEITPSSSTEFDVKVERTSEFGRNYKISDGAFISAPDLGIPARARKELDKRTN